VHGSPRTIVAAGEGLARRDLEEDDRRPLRFLFEAASLRDAVDLADALRSRGGSRVRVRPCSLRLLARRHWTVVATTPPAPVLEAVERLWEAEMRDAARRQRGCRLVGREPVRV
jgi:hypothetical protein